MIALILQNLNGLKTFIKPISNQVQTVSKQTPLGAINLNWMSLELGNKTIEFNIEATKIAKQACFEFKKKFTS